MLEVSFEILVVNAQHIKNVPGRKTDVKDAEWIAQLLQHGLLRGSLISPLPQRDLRDLTRSRTNLVRERVTVVTRVDKSAGMGQYQTGLCGQRYQWCFGKANAECHRSRDL